MLTLNISEGREIKARSERVEPASERPSIIVRKIASGNERRDTDMYTRAWNIYSRAVTRQPAAVNGLGLV
jgi:hypothetical protein